MPLKTYQQYETDVIKLGFVGIKKDNTLFNAVSKALEKAQNKDQFLYLNDKKRDPDHLYIKYIKDNTINISAALQKAAATLCVGPAADPAKAKVVIKGIDQEALKLFNQNLAGRLKDNPSFKLWCDAQNIPEAKKMADQNAKVLSKKLGIKDVVALSKAIQATILGNKSEAMKALEKLAKDEHLKDKAEVIYKNLVNLGLA